jgi:hypothetical protein
MMYAAKDAGERMCPVKVDESCGGSGCPIWRFSLTPNALVVAAIKRAMAETGENGLKHTEAARLVADEPERFGLPVGEDRMGWCGMGGKPEVAA